MPTRRKVAAALRYDGTGAPEIVASGRGDLAERILAAAREASVPIREDRVLAEALAALEVGSEATPELYKAVAAALIWAYGISRRSPPLTNGRSR